MRRFEDYQAFERVTSWQAGPRGLTAEVHGQPMRVEVVRADVVRLAIGSGGRLDPAPTEAVCVDPFARHVPVEVELAADRATVTTAALVVTVDREPFRLAVHRRDGSPVVDMPLAWHVPPASDGRPLPDVPRRMARTPGYATLNDAFLLRRACRPGDAFFGLGEKGGPANRRGRDFTLWNTDVLSPHGSAEFTRDRAPDDPRADRRSPLFDPFYVSIPMLYHQVGPGGPVAGFFLDNGYRLEYHLSDPTEYRIHAAGGQYVEYVFAGPDMPGILEAYTWLTGRPVLPPLWSLGHHHCRWHPYTDADLTALADRHRAEGVPLDAVWLDIDHMDGYRVFTWDRERFPDPAGWLAQLRGRGVRVVTIVDPGVKQEPGYPVYDQAVEADLLCRTEGGEHYVGQVWPGRTVFPDFTDPAARRWWGRLTAAQAALGVAGIWNDMNEPATGRIPPDRMRFEHGRVTHERYHNQYGLLMAKATVGGLREAAPQGRTFVLTRAGFAGIQRYAATWMGDNLSRWDHLANSVPMAAGLGVCGQPFVGADVGGFQGDCHGELFLRWMQYGALTPFFRNHSEAGNIDQYPWSFGPVVLAGVTEAIRLRYRLLPYLYSSFRQAVATGAPVQRPLVFDYQDDPLAADIDDEYLLGRDILVAPVLTAGQTRRRVYLPAGQWWDWHGGVRHEGSGFLDVDTPMDRIPVYLRAGAVIPMWLDPPDSADGHHPDTLDLVLPLPGRDGSTTSTSYEDDGLTTGALDGAEVRTRFEVSRSGRRVSVTGSADGSGYPEFARTAFRVHLLGEEPTAAQVDGARVDRAPGHDHPVYRIPNGGGDLRAEFTLP